MLLCARPVRPTPMPITDRIPQRQNERPEDPVHRDPHVPHEQECLKFRGHQCNCWMADSDRRRNQLRKLRQELGLYGFDAIFAVENKSMTDLHEKKRRELCSGWKKPLRDDLADRWHAFVKRVKLYTS